MISNVASRHFHFLFVWSDRDGGYSEWSDWTNCTATCGRSGSRIRQRSCDNPLPDGNGVDCVGDGEDIEKCGYENLVGLLAAH